jgi:hypothetical protein
VSQLAVAQPIPVRYSQGSERGFLVVKSKGNVIAVGDLMQVAEGAAFRSHVLIRFRDGSVDEESTTFSAQNELRLISDHHVQKGPSFPTPLDVTIAVPASEVKWTEIKDGHAVTNRKHIDLPKDLANGLLPLVMENIRPSAAETRVSYLVNDPKPRIIAISVKPDGKQDFVIAGVIFPANRYLLHIDIGGLAGMIAPLIGKQPPDMHEWVISGEVPSVARLEGPFYQDGPIWTIEAAMPSVADVAATR